MDVLQKELYRVSIHWNIHRIRPTKNSESPSGHPDVNYFVPGLSTGNITDYISEVDREDIEIVENVFPDRPSPDGCSSEFRELVEMIMEDEDLQIPTTPDEAKQLYIELLSQINIL